MRLAIYDDLHLEGDGKCRMELADADVCILAGDICVATYLQPHRTDADARGHKKAVARFFDRLSEKYDRILYVMGNHEHYDGVFELTPVILRDFLAQWPKVRLLEKEGIVIGRVMFYGATLWTSCNNNNPITVEVLKGYLNDFECITRQGGATWHPTMSYLDHLDALDCLQDALTVADRLRRENTIDSFVVITHHCPTELSCDERFRDEYQGNFGYFSSLENLIFDNKIDVWFHGHVHVAKDYYLEDTRIVCNPRGYRGEVKSGITGFDEGKVIEVNG